MEYNKESIWNTTRNQRGMQTVYSVHCTCQSFCNKVPNSLLCKIECRLETDYIYVNWFDGSADLHLLKLFSDSGSKLINGKLKEKLAFK